MSTNRNTTTPENNVSEILSRSEKFIEKNQKTILIAIGAIVLIVVAVMWFRNSYLVPKEIEAETALFRAENYFNNNDWNLALNGDSVESVGLLDIIQEYGSTKSGKLAKAYAGICYFHMGEPEKALEYLKQFSVDDVLVGPAITGLIGNCYVEMEKTEEGISYFEKAAKMADNNLLSPIFLKKAGIAYESLGKYQQAIDAYSTILNKYPSSNEGLSIERYIDRAKLRMEGKK